MIIKMMADRIGYLKAIKDVRDEWLENLLLFLGIDIQEIHKMDSATFLDYLNKNKIEIIEYLNLNAISVTQDKELVGEWSEPCLVLKKDFETGSLYYEVEIECWSVIEENIEIK